MNKIFEQVGVSPNVSRSSFDHGHENKLTFNYGELIPTLCYQLIPGDSGKISVESLLRQQTMIAPIMQRSNVSHHFFKVPMRLLDANFKQKRTRWNSVTNETLDIDAPYITIRDLARVWVTKDFFNMDPSRNVESYGRSYFVLTSDTYDSWGDILDEVRNVAFGDYTSFHPILSYGGTLLDYLGFPCGPHYQNGINVTNDNYYASILESVPSDNEIHYSLYPILAYNLIYMTWYRDQNIEKDWLHGILESMSSSTLVDPHYAPWTQRNRRSTAVVLSVKLRAFSKDYFTSMLPRTVKSTEFPNGISAPVVNGGVSIEGLRIANAMQQWLERDNRGGSRYPEWLLSHFGVTSSYGLLDYPEFLGGFSSPLAVSEVTQNSATNEVSPQGNLAGKSTNYDNSNVLSYYSEEDSYLICITSVLPKQGYSQGVSKVLTRTDFVDDFYMPEFANLGEQSVKRSELQTLFGDFDIIVNPRAGIVDPSNPTVAINLTDDPSVIADAVLTIIPPNFTLQNQVIGYQSRYSDWKFSNDEIHGEFRNNLDYWHMSRVFKYLPDDYLNLDKLKDFVKTLIADYPDGVTYRVSQIVALNNDLLKCKPSDVDRVFAIRHDVSAQIKLQMFFSHYAVRRMPEFPIPHL